MATVTQVISAVRVSVDQYEFAIKSGSCEYKYGKPERNVVGLDDGSKCYSEDTSTAIGMIKFNIPNTKENNTAVDELESKGIVSVRLTANEGAGEVIKTMTGVSMNNSNRTTGTDGMITVEIQGTELV